MTYRIFCYAGKVTDRIDTYRNRSDLSLDEKARTEVATALGVDVGAITVDHVEEKPLVEVVIPPTPPSPEDTDLDALVLILNKPDADVTAAELKAVVLRALRRLHRKGRLR